MRTNLHKKFKTNIDLETKGIWFEVDSGVSFLITRFGGFNSPSVKKQMAKYHKPHAKQIELGALSPEKEREIMIQIFVEACIKDWKGVTTEDGQEIPFSISECVKLFCELPDMADVLIGQASDYNNYREELGNS